MEGAVADRCLAGVEGQTSAVTGKIPADGAISDCQYAVVGDAAPCARGGIPGHRAFNNRQRTAIVDAPISVPADGAVVDRQRTESADAAAKKICLVAGYYALVDRHRPAVVEDAATGASKVTMRTIPDNGTVINGEHCVCSYKDATAAAPSPYPHRIVTDYAIVDRQRPFVFNEDAAPIVLRSAVANSHIRKDHPRKRRNPEHTPSAPAIDDGCAGIGANNVQRERNADVLGIGRCGNPDEIAPRTKRNCVPDSFAGSLGRLAVVVVIPVHSVDIP